MNNCLFVCLLISLFIIGAHQASGDCCARLGQMVPSPLAFGQNSAVQTIAL